MVAVGSARERQKAVIDISRLKVLGAIHACLEDKLANLTNDGRTGR